MRRLDLYLRRRKGGLAQEAEMFLASARFRVVRVPSPQMIYGGGG